MKSILIIAIGILALSNSALAAQNQKDILQALIADSALYVSDTSCEGEKWPRVSDFLAEALSVSVGSGAADEVELRCPMEDEKGASCEFLLNYTKGPLAYTRMLRFFYLGTEKKIDPKSVHCVDVP